MGSKSQQVVAFIPVRGGSKSIPLKNIQPINGQPLVYWTLAACAGSRFVRDVFVATESPVIRQCVESLKLPKVTVVSRSAASATDTASTEAAMLEFAAEQQFDHIALVQATSPLLTTEDVDSALAQYFSSGADALLTVVRTRRFLWEPAGQYVKPVNYDPARRPRRQEWDGQLVENGALYVTSRQRLLETGCRMSGNIVAHEMPEEAYFEIDEPSDWLIMEGLLRARHSMRGDLAHAASAVKLLCTDVDGTLTDGGMYYTGEGELMKRFDTRDAFGMNLLRQRGILTAIMTAEDSPIVLARGRKLRMEHVYVGVSDKETCMQGLLDRLGLDWRELAYIGDDLNDLAVIRRAGVSACPADAADQVRQCATYVCKSPGGHGAVREFCEVVLSAIAPRPR